MEAVANLQHKCCKIASIRHFCCNFAITACRPRLRRPSACRSGGAIRRNSISSCRRRGRCVRRVPSPSPGSLPALPSQSSASSPLAPLATPAPHVAPATPFRLRASDSCGTRRAMRVTVVSPASMPCPRWSPTLELVAPARPALLACRPCCCRCTVCKDAGVNARTPLHAITRYRGR